MSLIKTLGYHPIIDEDDFNWYIWRDGKRRRVFKNDARFSWIIGVVND